MTLQCPLLSISTLLFQEIMQHLHDFDLVSMRQVSTSLQKQVTQNLPHITLVLSNSSSKEQMTQWDQATQKLSHVSSVHLHVTGEVATDISDLAMQLLSQRTALTELQLLAAGQDRHSTTDYSNYSSSSCVTTLQPLRHLMAQLQTLVIKGVAAQNVVHDLKMLAAAAPAGGGWRKLQSLTLTAPLSYNGSAHAGRGSDFCHALKHITAAFPGLLELIIEAPRLTAPKATAVDIRMHSYQPSLNVNGEWAFTALAEIAVLAALANAVLQLRSLSRLVVTGVPDIWADEKPTQVEAKAAVAAGPSILAAVNKPLSSGVVHSVSAAAALFGTLDDFGCWLLHQHPSLRQLQISLNTDQYERGMSWQRQVQQSLYTDGRNKLLTRTAAARSAAGAVKLYDFSVDSYCPNTTAHAAGQSQLFSNGEASTDVTTAACRCSSSSSIFQLSTVLCSAFSRYTSRPAVCLLPGITSCCLGLNQLHVHGFVAVLEDLHSLSHLEVTLIPSYVSNNPNASIRAVLLAAEAVTAAAAAVTGLQSLAMRVEHPAHIFATTGLLCPLTAAAGGPRRSLKKLELAGHFLTTAEEAEAAIQRLVDRCALQSLELQQRLPGLGFTDLSNAAQTDAEQSFLEEAFEIFASSNSSDMATQVMTAASARSSNATLRDSNQAVQPYQAGMHSSGQQQQPAGSATAVCPGFRWYIALPFTTLRELTVHPQGNMLHLPAEALPASLEVLVGSKLNIVSMLEYDEMSASEFKLMFPASKRCQLTGVVAGATPCLKQLQLTSSLLSDPYFLASSQLQQLTVLHTSWPRGWSSAAVAWPRLRQLVTSCTQTERVNDYSNYCFYYVKGIVHNSEQPMQPNRMLTDILFYFPQLRSLSVKGFPSSFSSDAQLAAVEESVQRWPRHIHVCHPGSTFHLRCTPREKQLFK